MQRPTGLELDWRRLPSPVPWTEVFGREGPLEVEIGFGNGAFLEALALQHPERNLVGIERSRGSVERALKRLGRAGVVNVRLLWVDATVSLGRFFDLGSLDAVYINYPDPWPKARHHKRRLIQRPFLDELAWRLKAGGRLEIATDHEGYAEWIAEHLQAHPSFAPLTPTPWVPEVPGRPTTRYEQKWRALGRRLHYFLWQKVADPPGPPPAPVVEEEAEGEMPHVILRTRATPVEAVQALRDLPVLDRHGDRIAKLLRAYADVAGEEGLVDAVAVDGGLQQRFLIRIAPHPEGVILKLAPQTTPRRTKGVKACLALLARQLLQALPDAAWAGDNLGFGRREKEG